MCKLTIRICNGFNLAFWLIFLYRRFENTSKKCSLLLMFLMNVISWFQNGMISRITVFFERFILFLKLNEYKSLLYCAFHNLSIWKFINFRHSQNGCFTLILLAALDQRFTIMAVWPNQESSERAVCKHRLSADLHWGQLYLAFLIRSFSRKHNW